jgi:asparagine synthetase B (glutamine-hydrolysing)
MCGICFILGGLPISSHNFDSFPFFASYLHNSTASLSQHIVESKLLLPHGFEADKIRERLCERGPDHFETTAVDMFKIATEQAHLENLEHNFVVEEGLAYGFQSTLHLRGDAIYKPSQPASFFLYNGEVFDTGTLPPVEDHQNDSEWFHQQLLECKGSRAKICELLQQIRGDFAFIFVEGSDIFIGKDYFGKRSLLLGMGEDYIVVTSTPIHSLNRAIQQENLPEEHEADEDVQN